MARFGDISDSSRSVFLCSFLDKSTGLLSGTVKHLSHRAFCRICCYIQFRPEYSSRLLLAEYFWSHLDINNISDNALCDKCLIVVITYGGIFTISMRLQLGQPTTYIYIGFFVSQVKHEKKSHCIPEECSC